jgi:hypothetical protein
MILENRTTNGEPEAHASRFGREEWIEYTIPIFERYPGAGILNGQQDR